MKETALHELDERLRRLAVNARTALAQGNADYALDVLRDVFAAAPGCAEMRRVWWQALCEKQSPAGARLWDKARGLLRGKGPDPAGGPLAVLQAACARVERSPRDAGALRAMAEAAQALGWSGTEGFAREALARLAPRDRTAALAWADALRRGGDFDAAERAIRGCLEMYPHDGDAREALRALGVARTLREGRWDQDGTFRDKLQE